MDQKERQAILALAQILKTAAFEPLSDTVSLPPEAMSRLDEVISETQQDPGIPRGFLNRGPLARLVRNVTSMPSQGEVAEYGPRAYEMAHGPVAARATGDPIALLPLDGSRSEGVIGKLSPSAPEAEPSNASDALLGGLTGAVAGGATGSKIPGMLGGIFGGAAGRVGIQNLLAHLLPMLGPGAMSEILTQAGPFAGSLLGAVGGNKLVSSLTSGDSDGAQAKAPKRKVPTEDELYRQLALAGGSR
jgi:hypothetical protein